MIEPGCAPSASRMPISLVRCADCRGPLQRDTAAEAGVKCAAEGLASTREPGHDAADRNLQYVGQFLVGKALHQDEGRLIQNTIDARRELAFLFASDQVDAQLASTEENP